MVAPIQVAGQRLHLASYTTLALVQLVVLDCSIGHLRKLHFSWDCRFEVNCSIVMGRGLTIRTVSRPLRCRIDWAVALNESVMNGRCSTLLNFFFVLVLDVVSLLRYWRCDSLLIHRWGYPLRCNLLPAILIASSL